MLVLGIAIVRHWALTDLHFQGSISAYFYTPIRPVFVGVLFACGIGLVAYSSSDIVENMLLNLSGVMAFFVATIPTPPDKDDLAGALAASDSMDYGATAVIITSVLAYLMQVGVSRRWLPSALAGAPGAAEETSPDQRRPTRVARVVAIVTMATVIVFTVALVTKYDGRQKLHYVAAILLFAGMAVVAILNARRAGHRRHQMAYGIAATGMVAITILAAIAHFAPSGSLVKCISLFYSEAGLIASFMLHWITQSLELHGRISGRPTPTAETPQ